MASAQLGGNQVHVRRHWAFVYYHNYYGVIMVDVRIFKIQKLEIVYAYINTGTMAQIRLIGLTEFHFNIHTCMVNPT